jgi:hypothetical protein
VPEKSFSRDGLKKPALYWVANALKFRLYEPETPETLLGFLRIPQVVEEGLYQNLLSYNLHEEVLNKFFVVV